MKKKCILVTGGAGFIGSHTVDLLLKQDYHVIVLDNLVSGKKNNLDLNHPNLQLIEGSILDFPLLLKLIAKCHAVLHLAAIVSVPESINRPIASFEVNSQGFLHIIEAIRQAEQPIRLVYASSAAVYGNAIDLPCCDQRVLQSLPLSPYALQKRQAEEYANLYEKLFGLSSLGLRYFNVYGSRQDPHSPYSGVISRFLAAYQQNKPLTLFGDGKQSRDFISVVDIAKANLLALESDYTGTINIATGYPQTLLQLIREIEILGGKSAQMIFMPERPGDIKTSFASVTLAKEKIGFTATLSLQMGMQSFFAA